MMPMMLLRPDGGRDRHGESGLTMTNQATTFPIDLFSARITRLSSASIMRSL